MSTRRRILTVALLVPAVWLATGCVQQGGGGTTISSDRGSAGTGNSGSIARNEK